MTPFEIFTGILVFIQLCGLVILICAFAKGLEKKTVKGMRITGYLAMVPADIALAIEHYMNHRPFLFVMFLVFAAVFIYFAISCATSKDEEDAEDDNPQQ